MSICQKLLDANRALKIDDWHVALNGRSIKCCGSGLSAPLTRFIPWRRSNGVPLRRGDDGVESVKSGSRDQSRLIVDPYVLDALKGIGKYNPLYNSAQQGFQAHIRALSH